MLSQQGYFFTGLTASARERVDRTRIGPPRLYAHFMASNPTSVVFPSSATPPAPVAGGILWIQQVSREIKPIAPGSAPTPARLFHGPRPPVNCFPVLCCTSCSCSRWGFVVPAGNMRDRADCARISPPRLHARFMATTPTSTVCLSSPTPPAPIAGGASWFQQVICETALITPGSAPPASTLVSRPQRPRQLFFCSLPHPLLL